MSSDRNRLGGWRSGGPSQGLGGPPGPPGSAGARGPSGERKGGFQGGVPAGMGAGGGIIALILVTFFLVVSAVFGLSKNPGRTLWYFFLGPFSNLYAFGNMLNSAIPLVFGGLGVSVA
ncbi:MAG: hypothetical protein LBS06_06100, partial [Treponema sp.]|nr:hypothetical protein [Treponema sp.]